MDDMKRWWWNLPAWVPGAEARRLADMEMENVLARNRVNEALRTLDEDLHSDDPEVRNRIQQLNEHSNRVQLEHRRTAVLDEERTLAVKRQNLLLATTARATWVAAFSAVAATLPALRELFR